jgi:hypothetical protein
MDHQKARLKDVSLPRRMTLRERKPLGDNVYDVCEINPNIEISFK